MTISANWRRSLNLILALAMTLTLGAAELEIGARAPGFDLVDSKTGEMVSFDPGESLSVVIFTCNQCPYAKAFEHRLVDLANDYQAKGVTFLAVNPNDDVKYPGETLDKMKQRAAEKKFPFPYLKDGDSAVAKAYGARVTPHVFVVDESGTVKYRGYVDDSAKPDEREHEGLRNALDALLADSPVPVKTTKAFGCTIKWKS